MALDIKISFSWINYCRLCLQDKGLKIPIFDKEGVTENISEKIKQCLNITTYDGDPLPRMICHQCLCKLNTAYELHQKAMESFRLLLTHLQPLKHVPSVHEYMKDCQASVETLESKDDTPVESKTSVLTPVKKPGPLSRTSNHKEHQYHEEHEELAHGRVTRSRVSGRSSLGSQDSGHSSQTGSITIVPNIENPSITSGTKECTSTGKDPVFLAPLPRKQKVENPFYSDDMDHNSNEELSKRKRKRITDYYDEALMDTGGNLVLAAGRNRESRHRDGKKKRIGPASRTRALATCLPFPSPWQCVMCSCYFESHNMLRRHLSNCLICQTCGQEFSSAKDKAIHEQAHMHVNLSRYVELVYKCNHCDRTFAAHLMLKQHIKYNHDESSAHSCHPSPYVDVDPQSAVEYGDTEDKDSCKCESDEEKKSEEANNIEEKGDERKEECPKCTRLFENKHRLAYHLLGHDSLIRCSFCPWMFPIGPGRRRHQRHMHADKKPTCYCCSVCSETFETKSILLLHKKSHRKSTETQEDANKVDGPSKKTELEHCHVCDKMIQPSKFMMHLMHHANDAYDGKQQSEDTVLEKDLQLECQLCHAVSASPELHRAHVAQKHAQQKSINFKCDGCSQSFANVEAINRHSCPGKETEKQWKNCEHCGQNLSEGINHVCDNECPICRKIFKSSRGQRLHLQHKHDNPESVPVNIDSSDVRSTDAIEGDLVPEPGAFEKVAVKEEKEDAEELMAESLDTAQPEETVEQSSDRMESATSLPSKDATEDVPTTKSHAVSDEPSSSTPPNLPAVLVTARQMPVNTESFPDYSTNGKGTPKIRLKPPGSLIIDPPPINAFPGAPSIIPKIQGFFVKPPPPYPSSSNETKITKSVIVRKTNIPMQMVVTDVGSTANSITNTLTPLPAAANSASNPRSDHSYTANFSPALPAPTPPSTYSPGVGTPVSTVSSSPKFVGPLTPCPMLITSSSSSQVVSSNVMATSGATNISRPVIGLSLASNPPIFINPKTEGRLPFPQSAQIIKEVQSPMNSLNQSQSIRCVQIAALQGVTPVSGPSTCTQIPSNRSNVGLGYGKMFNTIQPAPHPTVSHHFQPTSGAQGGEENLLRDVLLGRRFHDHDPL